MLHAMFQDHRTFGSGDDYPIPAWWPSWSCDLDHLYMLLFPFPWRLHINFGFDWPSGFGEDI